MQEPTRATEREQANAQGSLTLTLSRRERGVSAALAWLAGLAVLLGMNFFLRAVLEESPKHITSHFEDWLKSPEKIDAVYARPWYKLLRPIPELDGSWCATSHVLAMYPLERRFGATNVYLAMNLVFVAVAYITSWLAFRSWACTLTFGLCAALTTFNYHVYQCHGSTALYFIMSYLLVFLLAQYRLLARQGSRWLWWPVWAVSLALFALSYEGWLDYVVFLWVFAPLAAACWFRKRDTARLSRLGVMLLVVTLVAGGYIWAKRHYGFGQGVGSESDVVFNYPDRVVAVEDVISNVFTNFYLVITSYAPPWLVGSNSLWRHTPAELVHWQGGYHADQSHLAAMNHFFLWRYYAGAALAVFLYALVRVGKWAYRTGDRDALVVFALMLMILVASPTHALVKWRPMRALPFLAYNQYLGVIGMSLLLGHLAKLAGGRIRRPLAAQSLVGLLWLDIVLCALARPAFLGRMIELANMGHYPNPWVVLKQLGVGS